MRKRGKMDKDKMVKLEKGIGDIVTKYEQQNWLSGMTDEKGKKIPQLVDFERMYREIMRCIENTLNKTKEE